MRKARHQLVIALSLLVVCGCQPAAQEGQRVAPLKLGKVDVMRVMEERPETTEIRLDWATLAGKNYNELSKAKNQVEYQELQKQIAKQDEAWQKRMDTFMEKSIAEVEVEAEKVAREQGLDMIVVENPLTKTLKYCDGPDLSTDILIRLQSSGGQ